MLCAYTSPILSINHWNYKWCLPFEMFCLSVGFVVVAVAVFLVRYIFAFTLIYISFHFICWVLLYAFFSFIFFLSFIFSWLLRTRARVRNAVGLQIYEIHGGCGKPVSNYCSPFPHTNQFTFSFLHRIPIVCPLQFVRFAFRVCLVHICTQPNIPFDALPIAWNYRWISIAAEFEKYTCVFPCRLS